MSCWGEGSDGQLGNGATSDKTTPTLTSSLGTGRTALLIDGDKDGDGVYEHLDSYPGDSIRSINAILVNLVDINVLMLLWANLSRHLRSMYATDASPGYFSHLLVSRVQPHAVLVTIKHHPVKLPVMLLMQATMFLAQPKRARLLVLLEPLAARQDQARVLTLQQDILCHLLVSRVQPHAVLDTIKHPPVKHPVMLLMQATMFLAQPKRARLLVLLERLVVRQVRACVLTLLQDTVSSAGQSSATACSPVTIRIIRSNIL